MKISENWLREWVNPAVEQQQLLADITMAGLEVDGVEAAAEAFAGVIVGEIQALEPHPDADKLRVCQVSDGKGVFQVVCGASNARVGLKAPFATVGAVLPGDFKIKKAKLRGVESLGMLCGASELGFEDEIDGLMELPADAPVGQCLRDYLQLDDSIIELDLTPNRGDCLSTQGLAREVALIYQCDIQQAAIEPVAATIDTIFPVSIEASDDCPRYIGRVIEGVDLSRPTPMWMQERLRRAGVRSIDAVVDVTNYVMLELGQPMHAFDHALLDQGLVVRKAQAGEKITLLDESELKLKADDLVIADHSKALALAGIMGAENSGVNPATTTIVLESAYFAPLALAGRARSYGLHTDASHRFERGVDWQGQEQAIERATALLLDIVGGQAGPLNTVETAAKPQATTVKLTAKRLHQVLGMSFETAQITAILNGLGFEVTEQQDSWQCRVPSWRFDIGIEVDLIEEIARVYGYNKLPTRQLTVPVDFVPRHEGKRSLARLRHQLVAAGYQEAITYSFIEPKLQQQFSDSKAIKVQNPISTDLSVMRTSLIPGLVNAMRYNRKRQQQRVRLFESGLRFTTVDGAIEQTAMLAGLICGNRQLESWHGKEQAVDFFDIKGDVENLLAVCGHQQAQFVASEASYLHPGQSAKVLDNKGKELGVVGALHPELGKALGIQDNVFVFEMNLDALLHGCVPSFKPLSKHPQVRRDLALIVDAEVSSSALTDLVKQQAGEHLLDSFVFDVYQGEGVEQGKKSIALAAVFQHAERSLQDEEVQGIVDTLLNALSQQLGAELRV